MRKILQLSADHHARGDRFASCENIVSRSQTSSLPPSPRVFDNSAKYLGTSLNDQLLQRPDLTNSLVGVLSQANPLEQIALMADVEAMCHQVRVRPSDFDALRFLWWPNGNLDNEPKEYLIRVHLFGGASSPSCANFASKKTAQKKTEFDLETIEIEERNFYVDDCLKSVSSEELAVNLSGHLCELLAGGGFKLLAYRVALPFT